MNKKLFSMNLSRNILDSFWNLIKFDYFFNFLELRFDEARVPTDPADET